MGNVLPFLLGTGGIERDKKYSIVISSSWPQKFLVLHFFWTEGLVCLISKAVFLCSQIWITMQPWNRVKVWQERPFGTECRLVTFKVCLDVEKLEGKVAAQIVPMHKVVLLLCHDKLYTTNANKLYILFSGSKTMFYYHICRSLQFVILMLIWVLESIYWNMSKIQHCWKLGLLIRIHKHWYTFRYWNGFLIS